MLSDYKTDLTFLQAELTERFDGSNARESSEQPILNLAGLDVEMTNEGAVNSNTGAEDVKQLGTMSRSVSMRSRAGPTAAERMAAFRRRVIERIEV